MARTVKILTTISPVTWQTSTGELRRNHAGKTSAAALASVRSPATTKSSLWSVTRWSCTPQVGTAETIPQQCSTSCLTADPQLEWGRPWMLEDHRIQVNRFLECLILLNVQLCKSGLSCSTAAASFSVPGLYGYWHDRRASQFSESQRRMSSVRASFHPPACAEDRPSELESRLELLQSQLNRSVFL